MRTIADQWSDFDRLILRPTGAGNVQRVETKRAFYAGAQAVLNVMLEIACVDTSDEGGAAMLEGLHDECRRFGAEIAAGRA